ncbi:hypothetical protein [Kitasatospora sp. NPDC093806]|uniref:hypothetical protein n=1 Tax=Kitasatospora sp. NPDC093806 TaxID=3155075 RepID=UPI003414F142
MFRTVTVKAAAVTALALALTGLVPAVASADIIWDGPGATPTAPVTAPATPKAAPVAPAVAPAAASAAADDIIWD